MKRSIWNGAMKLLALVLFITLLPLTPARSQDPDSLPVIPDPPSPMPMPSGSPQEQAIAFANAMDATPDNVAAWLGLYDALDIPVIAPDGISLGVENSDPIGPAYWEVWYTSAATPAIGISLLDFGQLIALAMQDTDPSHDYSALLLQDLRASATSTDSRIQLLALFVNERMTRGGMSSLDEAATPDQLTVDAALVLLLGWEVIRAGVYEVATQSSAALPDAAFKLTENPHPYQPARTSLGDACDGQNVISNESAMQGWVEYAVEQIATDKRAFTTALINIGQQLGLEMGQEVVWLADIQHIMPAGYMLAILLAGFHVDVSASPAPFVRTKSQAEWGESAEVKLTLNFSSNFLPSGDVRILCAAYFATQTFGGDFNAPPDGPMSGAHLITTLVENTDRVGFTGDTAVDDYTRVSGTTDGSGQFTTPIKGRQQPHEIPETAAKIDLDYAMVVLLDLEELAGLNGDTTLTAGATTIFHIPAGTNTPLTQALNQMRSRFRLGRYQFPFQDWEPQLWQAMLANVHTETYTCDFTEPISIHDSVTFGAMTQTYTVVLSPTTPTSGTFTETIGSTIPGADGGTIELNGTYTLTFADHGGIGQDAINVDMLTSEACVVAGAQRMCQDIPMSDVAPIAFISVGKCESE